ncbi:hypothetical protein [Paenisporosarcina cavernae]|uniref:Uncharacterized protein n=1 Tax=Paenisporosarcina cavernae TaxID=2320858 RepID=A0A385YTP7_9BACL|nr:hypothetical protein [Paenisporosarcina cavernae]AYC30036.1 hypothetical protein D3873_09180 [Paenisporosarcina cavernae]
MNVSKKVIEIRTSEIASKLRKLNDREQRQFSALLNCLLANKEESIRFLDTFEDALDYSTKEKSPQVAGTTTEENRLGQLCKSIDEFETADGRKKTGVLSFNPLDPN